MKWGGILALAVAAGCSEQVVERAETRPLVRVGAARQNVTFVDALRVQGSVRAKDAAGVSARIPGTIDAVFVDEGARVKKGDALFQVDRQNLENAVRAAKDDLAMAKAKLAQAEATVGKAKMDAERMARLFEGSAVTKDSLEKAQVAAKSAAAAFEAAQATVTKAETGLAVAEKNLSDSCVRSPYNAIVTRKRQNVGDYVGPGVRVFDIENPSVYEISFSLNAAHYARVKPGETTVRLDKPLAGTRDIPLSYRSPTVNAVTRTFEVRAQLPRTEDVAAGMLLDGEIVFASHTGQGVPSSAVADRGGSDAVFAVENGKAVRIAVETGLETDGWREIVSPALCPGKKIILEGMLLVNEGDEVRTQDVSL
ncbi:MAG: efflux RND transporter periplasmic adaptor subunit [Kiritimatiellae bacterium]|nr:efflux RND transporter periplasmic adaptor subunit [Kiritimatiellia bacterium]